MLFVLGDPPVGFSAFGVVVAFVLVGLAVIVVAVAYVLVGVTVMVVVLVLSVVVVVIVVVLVLAFVLIGVAVMVIVFVLSVVVVVLVLAFVVVVVFVLAKDADLLLIATAVRRSGGIHPGGRACSASSSRCARARSIPAGPKGVPVSQVGRLRGEVNHDCLRAVVADGDVLRGSSCGRRGGSRSTSGPRACGGTRRSRCRTCRGARAGGGTRRTSAVIHRHRILPTWARSEYLQVVRAGRTSYGVGALGRTGVGKRTGYGLIILVEDRYEQAQVHTLLDIRKYIVYVPISAGDSE
jgi:hypothetical protein